MSSMTRSSIQYQAKLFFVGVVTSFFCLSSSVATVELDFVLPSDGVDVF